MPSGLEPRNNETTHYNEGMSLRDWFAGQAITNIVTTDDFSPSIELEANEKEIAERARLLALIAYTMADAMLEVREITP